MPLIEVSLLKGYLSQFFLEWEIFQTIYIENQKTHFVSNIYIYIYILNHTVFKIMWKNSAREDKEDRGTWAFHTGYQRLQTLRICNTYCLSTATMVTWTRLIVISYVHCLSCVLISLPHATHLIFRYYGAREQEICGTQQCLTWGSQIHLLEIMKYWRIYWYAVTFMITFISCKIANTDTWN